MVMHKTLWMLTIAVWCGACGSGDAAIRSNVQNSLALVDITVVPMDSDRVLPRHSVIIRDGTITALGPVAEIQIPDNAHRIDGAGLYVTPGLVDAHVHVRDARELLSYLRHGVTTVVHLSGATGTIPDVLDLRAQVLRGDLPGPTIHASGRILDGQPPIFPGVSTVVRTPAEGRRAVETQIAAGVDLIKVYNNVRTETLRSILQTADSHHVTVWGHLPRIDGRDSALHRALSAGLDVIAHGEEVFFTMLYRDVENQLDRGRIPAVDPRLSSDAVRLIREHGAVVIPNLSFVAMTRRQLDDIEQLWTDSEAAFLHPETLAMWKQQNAARRQDIQRFDLRERGKQAVVRQLTKDLSDAGVTLLLGSDASAPGMFPGTSAHLELSELVAAGLSPYQALAAATRAPGKYLDRHTRQSPPFGTIAVGSRADLLIVKANPLTDVSNVAQIAGVIVRGEWYTRAQLDSLRASSIRSSGR